ncbi:hypothetical protein O7602_07800 [Micromonospora sp. WMMD1128]|uniref:hypothetical protein n=1 Tax=unclassified Micromonospora TaxID=2617518 RepID=UPI00248B697E|nr:MULTISPECIES: hypothetical protein [unclassified Micromonospora]WBB75406.1 hypothetical protein O7602_07800 [Micromonospora sp. WMMD1128]WFE31203.1 hypothetical protein O7613_16330 [Micromonospora sp. WMMD975]
MRRPLAVLGLLVTLVAACRAPEAPAPAPEPLRPAWQPVDLPLPSGLSGRVALRDAAACGGRWFVVGAVLDADGVPHPAAWSSVDARAWTALRPVPRSPYGPENLLTAVGCRDGRPVAVGGRSGGVHGNPRISTWRLDADGALVEVPAEFEVFGGPDAVNVGRVVGGPGGWLISGNRATGAAAWVSADGSDFRLVSGVPGLATDGAGRPWVADGAAAGSGWLMVGSVLPSGRTGTDAAVWTSPDGSAWRRAVLPGGGVDQDLQRVVRVGDRAVAVGRRGDGLGAWVAEGDDWRPGGDVPGGAERPGRVWGLSARGDGAFAVVAGVASEAGWFSPDGGRWSPVALPVAVPWGNDRSVAVAAAGDVALLSVDDGVRARVWSARGAWRPA